MSSRYISRKNIIFSAFLTAVEYYDFIIYAYLSTYIANVFFPQGHHALHLLETYALFGLGYFMRPLGGAFFGHIGDRLGRKVALMITVILMTCSLLMMTLVPTYQVIGITAPILLLLARLLQGFAIGGEYNGVLVTLIENAPRWRRARTTFLSVFISGNSVILATLVVMVLTGIYNHHAMLHFAWRYPYYIGVFLSLIALVFIYYLEETDSFIELEDKHKLAKLPLVEAFKNHPWVIGLVLLLTGYLGVAYYMAATYIPNLMTDMLNFTHHTAVTATLIASIVYAYTAPLWAQLTDKLGRKPILITTIILIMIGIIPEFLALHSHNIALIILAYSVMMALISACTVTFEVTINEAFPARIRYSGVAIGYNIGNALFGGSALYVSQALVDWGGNIYMPALYLIVMSALTLVCVLRMTETRGRLAE